MGDETPVVPPVTTTTAPDATTQENKTGFDPSTLDEEGQKKVLDYAFQHPRFKELNEQAKEAKKLKEEQKKKEEESLKEQNKFKELYEKEKAEKDQILTARQQDKVDSEIKDAARKLGAVDEKAVLKLLDRAQVTYNEDGTVTGAEEAVKKLLEESPYLKGNGTTQPKVGDGTNPPNTDQSAKRFKASQLKDPKFFQENEADIMKAMKLGMIDDDTA